MPINYANVVIADAFDTWLVRTNNLVEALRTKVVTADSNAVTGNVAILGVTTSTGLRANTLVANTSTLDNVTSIRVTSNTVNANTATANIFTGGQATFSANLSVPLATITTAIANAITANVTITETATIDTLGANNITANTSTVVTGSFSANVSAPLGTFTNVVSNQVNAVGVVTNTFQATNVVTTRATANTVNANTVTANTVAVVNVNASGNVAAVNVTASANVTAPVGNFATSVSSNVGTFTNVVSTSVNAVSVVTNTLQATNVVTTRATSNTVNANTVTANTFVGVSATMSGNVTAAFMNVTSNLYATHAKFEVLEVVTGYAVTGVIETTGNEMKITGASPHVRLVTTAANTADFFVASEANTFFIGVDPNGDGVIDSYPMSINYATQQAALFGSNIIHLGNDGAGSTFDADLLDGNHGSYYQNLGNMTGTLADARLTSNYTNVGTISSAGLTLRSQGSEGGQLDLLKGTGSTIVSNAVIDQAGGSVRIFDAGNSTKGYNFDITTGNITGMDGRTYWHSSNDGPGSGLNSDLLDSQDGAYYANIPARLGYTPLNQAGGTLTGDLGLNGVSSNFIRYGTGDGATYSTYNFSINGWNGMGMKDHTGTVRGVYNFRTGAWDALGGFWKNGVEAVYNNGGTYGINITGRAFPKRSDGNNIDIQWSGQAGQPSYVIGSNDGVNFPVWNPANFNVNYAATSGTATNANKLLLNGSGYGNFHYSGQGGQPTWLWGATDGTNSHLYNPSNFSVNYANSANYATTAGSAPANGGTATNSNQLGGVAASSWLQKGEFAGQFASIGYAELGSISLMKRTAGGTFNQGDTSSGAFLAFANADGSVISGTISGTYICLGRATGAGAGGSGVTLWKRIAA